MNNCTQIPLRQRMAYHGLTEQDLLSLAGIGEVVAPFLEQILDDFYSHVAQDREAAAVFRDVRHQEQAKAAQLRHWLHHVFCGRINDSYVEAVNDIGRAHLRAGVDLRLYIGGYGFILRELTAVLVREWNDKPGLVDALACVQKAVFLDMEIASSVYAVQSVQEFRQLSLTDVLTQLFNRRAIQDIGARLFSEARRYERPLCVALLDLDHFKSVNDRFGHPFGDLVLKGVADCLRSGLRSADVCGRWGGEEFILLLPGTPHNAAFLPLQRLIERIRLTPFWEEEQVVRVTASIGIAELSDRDKSFDDIVSRADDALYQAKHAGRDRVMAA